MAFLSLAALTLLAQSATPQEPAAPGRLQDVGSVVEGLSDTPAAAARPAAQGNAATGSAAERRTLAATVARGRQLFALARAGAVATQDMLTRVPDPAAANIAGWVAEPEGNGVAVTFYSEGADGPLAVYRGLVLGGRVSSHDLHLEGERPALSPLLARMAAARKAVEAGDRAVCGAGFNVLVVPPSNERAPIDVYQLSPMERSSPQIGGHHRTTVAADGSVAESVRLGGACETLTVPAAAAGQRPQPISVRRSATAMPNEVHVMTALLAGRPLVVNAGGRVWGVAGEGIAPLVATGAPRSARTPQGR